MIRSLHYMRNTEAWLNPMELLPIPLGEGKTMVKKNAKKMKAKNDLEAAKLGIAFFFQGVREQTQTLQNIFPEYDLIIGYGSFGLAEADKYKMPFISVVINPAMA